MSLTTESHPLGSCGCPRGSQRRASPELSQLVSDGHKARPKGSCEAPARRWEGNTTRPLTPELAPGRGTRTQVHSTLWTGHEPRHAGGRGGLSALEILPGVGVGGKRETRFESWLCRQLGHALSFPSAYLHCLSNRPELGSWKKCFSSTYCISDSERGRGNPPNRTQKCSQCHRRASLAPGAGELTSSGVSKDPPRAVGFTGPSRGQTGEVGWQCSEQVRADRRPGSNRCIPGAEAGAGAQETNICNKMELITHLRKLQGYLR